MSHKTKFFLDANKLKENYEKFSNIGQIYYPLKTNSNDVILGLLNKLYENSKNGFLITHLSHYDKLIKLGVSPDKMCLVNVLASDEDIYYLYNKGVRYFTFDNIDSLNNFLKYANPNEVKISIRLNIFEVFNVKSHLGTNTEECKKMFDLLKEKNIHNYGISFYLQKELMPEANVLNVMLDYIKNNFYNYNLEFINIGGAVKPDEIDLEKIEEVKKELNAKYIILEPGRYLVGNAGYMQTDIVRKKADDLYIIQNGIYSGLLDAKLYGKKYKIYFKDSEGNLIRLSEQESTLLSREITICGASSDSGDNIGKFYVDEDSQKELKVGTSIIVEDALAYTSEFLMPLGGIDDIEVIVLNEDVISKQSKK